MSILIKGSVRVTRRDPFGHSAPIMEQGPDEFVAEVGQLSGQPAFVDVHAIDDVEALPSTICARLAQNGVQEKLTRLRVDRSLRRSACGSGVARARHAAALPRSREREY